MQFEGFIEILPGIYYCEKDGSPWSCKVNLGDGKWGFGTELKKLNSKSRGYYIINIEGSNRIWHRLVFKHFRGYLPDMIDHKNNIRDDNRIDNLQETNNTSNCRKHKVAKNNTSGYAGVYFNKDSKKYMARITLNNKEIYLGCYKDPKEAYKAYLEAKIKYHGEETIKPLIA